VIKIGGTRSREIGMGEKWFHIAVDAVMNGKFLRRTEMVEQMS